MSRTILELQLVDETDQLGELIARIQDPAPAMRLIGSAMEDQVADSFRESRGPEGRRWLPIKPASNLAREHPSPPGKEPKPLIDTGVLRASFNSRVVEGGNAVSIGTPYEFYRYHQHDPDYPVDKHILPIRNVLPIKHQPLPERWRTEIIRTLEEHLGLDP